MIVTHQKWQVASIQIRKAHEDSIRLMTLSAHDHDESAVGYQRLALASLKAAADALGFTFEEIKN